MRSALVALALLVGGPALADVPPHVGRALGEARPAGSGRLTWFGLHVYDARLFVPAAGFDARRYAEQPFALELTYARRLQGRAIAERSDAEIAKLGIGTEAQRARWRQAMVALFPDVQAGQRLAGVHVPGTGHRVLLRRPADRPHRRSRLRRGVLRHLAGRPHHRPGPARQPPETGALT